MKVATTQFFVDPNAWVVISEEAAKRLEEKGLIKCFGVWNDNVTSQATLRLRIRKAFEDMP